MRKTVTIGNKTISEENPVFIIAEIGINHNGDILIAKKLIDMAVFAGCDAVKFQKRNPDICIPEKQKLMKKDTPWGKMSYLDYKKKIEFEFQEYSVIDNYCKEKGMIWFASPWDEDSVDFLEQLNVPCYKVASPCLTDHGLLRKMKQTGKPILLSSGMSTSQQLDKAIKVLGGTDDLVIMHCTSTYPAKPKEINLKVIITFKEKYDCPIGYSGHEVGLQVTYAAVALGAKVVERHITLDRTMWGTDHSASVEPFGLLRLVRDIHVVEQTIGDGLKKLYESEIPIMGKLRREDDTKKTV